jgi:RecA-family ATPase
MNVDQAAPIDLIWHGDPDGTPLKEWLIDEMLPKNGLALIAGQWGTYKTFVMLDLSASVMTKAQFAGREVHRQGGVLLLAAEGQSEVRLRVGRGAREGRRV